MGALLSEFQVCPTCELPQPSHTPDRVTKKTPSCFFFCKGFFYFLLLLWIFLDSGSEHYEPTYQRF